MAQPGRPMPGSPMPGPAASGPAPAARPVGPFDVAAPQAVAEKKVRLVIDDSAVKESEIGRAGGTRNIILIAIGAAVGLAAGFLVFSTKAERNQYTMAVRDGKDIYARINEVSKTLDQARTLLRGAVEASQGGPGRTAHVDYKAIEGLIAIKQPFSAGEFSRRRYLAFSTSAVDDLFEYYNNINLIWTKFQNLANKTAGDRAHEALDKSAQSADQLLAAEYGVVVSKSGDAFAGGVVVVRPKPADAAGAAPDAKEKPKGKGGKGAKKEEDDKTPIMLVSSRDGGKEVERKLFTGQPTFADKSGDYVIMIDKSHSMGTLGVSANLFGQFRGDLMDANGLMEKTLEIQGRLVKELGKVATLPETKFF
jgi:hypothetical protein